MCVCGTLSEQYCNCAIFSSLICTLDYTTQTEIETALLLLEKGGRYNALTARYKQKECSWFKNALYIDDESTLLTLVLAVVRAPAGASSAAAKALLFSDGVSTWVRRRRCCARGALGRASRRRMQLRLRSGGVIQRAPW